MRYIFARPFVDLSIFLPQRNSKYSSQLGPCGLAAALILMCRTIGGSDSFSKVYSLTLPSAVFSTVENTHRRDPRTLKYLSLTHGAPLRGCLLTAQSQSIVQTSLST